jgi:competence protein ComEA
MFRHIIIAAAALWASVVFAATDVNKATAAELDAIKGVGPSLSGKILDERKKGDFKDWPDFMQRIKGVKDARAARLSEAGLTVGGQPFKPAAKTAEKPAAKSKG